MSVYLYAGPIIITLGFLLFIVSTYTNSEKLGEWSWALAIIGQVTVVVSFLALFIF